MHRKKCKKTMRTTGENTAIDDCITACGETADNSKHLLRRLLQKSIPGKCIKPSINCSGNYIVDIG